MNRAQTQATAEQERLPPTDADLQGAIVDLMHMARSQERQSLNACMLQTYWRIGQQLVQFEHRGARTDGLSGLLAGLAARLNPLLGSHFSAQSLLECRAFYRAYPTLPAIRRKLSWHHYRLLLQIQNLQVRAWLAYIAAEQGWSVQTLESRIIALGHERPQNTLQPLRQAPQPTSTKGSDGDPRSFMNDPLVLGFLGITERPSLPAQGLKEALLGSLQQHLLQLEQGFAFVTRQKRLNTAGQDVCIDLVFYNYRLQRFVLIDLQLDTPGPVDTGSMDLAIRAFDEVHGQAADLPTLGLVLRSCSTIAQARYLLPDNSAAGTAPTGLECLPTPAELQAELQCQRRKLENRLSES